MQQRESGLSPLAMASLRELLTVVGNELSVTTPVTNQVDPPTRAGQSRPLMAGVNSQVSVSRVVDIPPVQPRQSMQRGSFQTTLPSGSDAAVAQAMKRPFKHIYTKADQPRGKKRFSAPATAVVKVTNFHVYVLPGPTEYTPKGPEDELQLALAGLGKRVIIMPENADHNEIEAQIFEEFPKLKTLKGGWMLYKSSGGSGRRKLSVILQATDGYTVQALKSVTNNGKSTIYLVPLQEELSTEPLPVDAPEFAKMPKANCMKCGCLLPLQMLTYHREGCTGNEIESPTSADEDCTFIEEPVVREEPVVCAVPKEPVVRAVRVADSPTAEMEDSTESCEVCPICQVAYPRDILPFHASICGDGLDTAPHRESTRLNGEELAGPSSERLKQVFAWETERDPEKACQLFRNDLLERNSHCPGLLLSLNMVESDEERDSTLISFYKRSNVNWAAPLRCRLTGDSAIGEAVNRHVLSLAMEKLKTGFSVNLGSASLTPLFEGEEDHQVPSADGGLRTGKLFEVAGRIIGHNFVHGGSGFPGLSLAVVALLIGRDTETAAAALTLEDVADLEHRETIGLLKKSELTEEEMTRVTKLCQCWYQPMPTSTNRDLLFQLLLSYAVLHHSTSPIRQIRKGLKETGVWPLLLTREDVHPIVFPRVSMVEILPGSMLERIQWPQEACDSDDEEDDPIPLEKISLVTAFLRKFIEEASPDVLRELTKFWVGWEQLPAELHVKVVTATYPVAHACLHSLELPAHYQMYRTFTDDMMMCLDSISSGLLNVLNVLQFAFCCRLKFS